MVSYGVSHHLTRVSLRTYSNIFGINLYEAGIGDKIEEMFVEEISGKGAIRETPGSA